MRLPTLVAPLNALADVTYLAGEALAALVIAGLGRFAPPSRPRLGLVT